MAVPGTISIIIPVYKVEQYLPKCIDSLVAQTYPALEIILVDDGSPDGCGRICDEYAAKDSRIRVIHKANAGVARARNDGLDIASGEYISFVDSDDWMAENAYELLMNAMQKNDADCVVGGCVTMLDHDGQLERKPGIALGPCTESSDEAMKRVLLDRSAVWNRLFRRKIFETLRFPLDRVNDDEVVALHAYAACSRISFIPDDTYFYRIRANSITTSSFSLRKVDCFYNARDNMAFIAAERPALLPCAEFKYIKTMLYCYVNLRRMKQRTPQETAAMNDLRALIRDGANRAMAMRNPHLPLAYKALMLLAAVV